jgi:putative PIN family toxin of toxin-antitoxin system
MHTLAPNSVATALATDVRALVLDTNIVLDLFVFKDPATPALLQSLQGGSLRWLASVPMRDELERVLAYPHIVARLNFYRLCAGDVLARFDALTHRVAVAPKVSLNCKDADDQKFVDLAAAHQAVLLSKDHAVLALAKRLRPFGVQTLTVYSD